MLVITIVSFIITIIIYEALYTTAKRLDPQNTFYFMSSRRQAESGIIGIGIISIIISLFFLDIRWINIIFWIFCILAIVFEIAPLCAMANKTNSVKQMMKAEIQKTSNEQEKQYLTDSFLTYSKLYSVILGSRILTLIYLAFIIFIFFPFK